MAICKFSEIKREAYLEAIRQGGRRHASAKAVGVHPNTVLKYIKDHPEFRDEIHEAELTACELVENALWKKCIEGNMTAIIFYLLNRSQGRWLDKRNQPQHNPAAELEEEREQLKFIREASETTQTQHLQAPA
jgi:hypothetical protein